MGSRRRGWYRTGDNIVDSPHRLHAWLVPLKVTLTEHKPRAEVPGRAFRKISSLAAELAPNLIGSVGSGVDPANRGFNVVAARPDRSGIAGLH